MTAKVTLDSAGAPIAIDPSLQLDILLGDADTALQEDGFAVWIVIDRLDVAFPQNADIERLALRALFRTYNDIQGRRRPESSFNSSIVSRLAN